MTRCEGVVEGPDSPESFIFSLSFVTDPNNQYPPHYRFPISKHFHIHVIWSSLPPFRVDRYYPHFQMKKLSLREDLPKFVQWVSVGAGTQPQVF